MWLAIRRWRRSAHSSSAIGGASILRRCYVNGRQNRKWCKGAAREPWTWSWTARQERKMMRWERMRKKSIWIRLLNRTCSSRQGFILEIKKKLNNWGILEFFPSLQVKMDGISPPHSDSPLPSSDISVAGNPNSTQSSPPLTQPPPLLRPAPPSAPPSLLRQPPPLQTRPLQNRTPHNHPPPPLIRPAVAPSLHQGALRNSLSSSSGSAGQLPPSLVGLKVESPQSHWSPCSICPFIMV